MTENIEIMPKEYYGKLLPHPGNSKTIPREWTEKEEEWLRKCLDKGYTTKEIAISMNRSEMSIYHKRKRFNFKDKTYNKDHIKEKYMIDLSFCDLLHTKTILDVYSGDSNKYKKYKVTTNDLNKDFDTDYHMDSLKLMCKLYSENKKYDVVDLDPYGSAYDCFDLAIKMAKKGIIISLGEMNMNRWGYSDFGKLYYGIKSLKNFTSDNMIKHIQTIGLRNGKILTVYAKKDWKSISRVWFTIKPYHNKKVFEKRSVKQL